MVVLDGLIQSAAPWVMDAEEVADFEREVQEHLAKKFVEEIAEAAADPITSSIVIPGFHVFHYELEPMKLSLKALGAGLAIAVLVAGTLVWGVNGLQAAVVPLPDPPVATSTSTPALQQTVDRFASEQSVPFGIEVINLKTGEAAGHDANLAFTTASIYKLFVALGVMQKVDRHQIKLASVSNCLNLMITVSSNDCGHSLGQSVGWSAYNPELKNLGFASTSLDENNLRTNAGDVAHYFQKLYAGQLLSPSSTQYLLGLLKSQRINNRLPLGLPAGTMIAHKTGDLDGLMHDAGIVYGPKTDYVIVALSGPWQRDTDSFAQFANLSRSVYQNLNQ